MRMLLKKPYFYFLVLVVIGIIGFMRSGHKKVEAQNKLPISVTVTSVVQKDVVLPAVATGKVIPNTTVSIKSRVEGQLLKVSFKEGDFVKKDQVLFSIDPHSYQMAFTQAQANLNRDVAQLVQLKKLLERYLPLVKKGYVSKQEFDKADANVKAQEAMILADQALLNNAKLNLEYTTIRAPIAGRSGNVLVHAGNLIRNDANPLVIINQITPIQVIFSLPEQQLNEVKKSYLQGSVPVTIYLKESQKKLIGQLSFIDNSVDPSTGMIQLKAEFANSQEELWPGQYVEISLPLTTLKQALLIPTRAIQMGPQGAYVFVVKDDSSVTMQQVKCGAIVGEETLVENLSPDIKVVTTGYSQLIEGSLVRL